MPGIVEHHSHFLLRVRRSEEASGAAAPDLEGLVEDLGTGEKRAFDGGAALLALLTSWSGRRPAVVRVAAPAPAAVGTSEP